MTTTTRSFAGLLGGLSLGVLTLMKANFYLGEGTMPDDRLIGFVAVVAYIFLGTVAGGVFAEREGADHKQLKSAFVTGLIAPPSFSRSSPARPAPRVRVPRHFRKRYARRSAQLNGLLEGIEGLGAPDRVRTGRRS